MSIESFNALNADLRSVPATWVPALLNTLVARAVKAKVFTADGLVRFVERAAARAKEASDDE